MLYKIINQNKSCSDGLEQLLLKSTRRRRRKRRRRGISFTLRKTVPICGAGTMLIDNSKMNVDQKKWKGSCQWIVPEKRALSWVLSNLSCSFISIIDWLIGFGQIKSHLLSLGFYCSLSAVTRITVMNCILLQNTYCPSLQASPSLERNHTFCSFEVRLSLWLPSRCFKSQYLLPHDLFTHPSTSNVSNRGCSGSLAPEWQASPREATTDLAWTCSISKE